MDKVHVYMCLHIASNKSTAGNKTRFYLARYSILPARASLWPQHFGTAT